MFYSLSLLSRKGPLGTIWIAAYCFKKLKRGQIDSTDISSTVDKIMPEIQISHRVLAQLLLGIVKIFSKKVDFLYDECNEALNQMRKYLPPTQRIIQIKASARPRKGIRGCKDVTSSIDHAAMTMKEHSTEKLIEIETMLASYHEVTVNLPERFELDSFDLEILDDGDNGGSHQHSTPLDDWSGKRTKPSYLYECLTNEVVSLSDYKSYCFTPLADVLPSSMMDVDLEHSEAHDNSSNFSSVQRSLVKFHLGGETEKRVCLSGSMPLHEIQESHISLHHEQTVPSVRDEILPVEEQRNLTEITNLQGINITSMMDVDLERSETHKSSNSVSVQKSQEECHHGGDLERQVCLSGIVHLHDVVIESHIPLNHEQREPSLGDQNPPVEEQRNLTVTTNLQEELTSEIGKANTISEKHADASPSDKQKTKISGTVSPKFMLATPAIQESSLVLRKKKRKYNESIILSNKFMSQSIHDASDLVCKRRKLPQTDLDIWKFWRFSKHCQSFTDCLIPFSCPALEKLPQKKLSQLSKKSAVGLIESTNVKDGMPEYLMRDEIAEHSVQNLDEMSHYLPKESVVDHLDPTNLEDTMPHINTETETEVLMQKLDRTCPTPLKSSDAKANSLENVNKEFTSPDASDYQFEIMELCFRGDDIGEQVNGWSPSTRAAAQYLYNRFLMLREQKQDADLSLAQILEGKTRATCARFIYETLTLKTYGCIDARQDCPYGDVSISATPVLESFHKVSM